MPDPTLQTVSATEIGAIMNVDSAYETEWMVYQRFIGEDLLPEEDNERMRIGRAIQPCILNLVAEEYRLDVVHNTDDEYYRHESLPIGCTPDGLVDCPTRGRGVVECKNVDWVVWKNTWAFRDGECIAAPKHIELQVHHQMMVLNASWAIIAALVGGNELIILERKPNFQVIKVITDTVNAFLRRVENRSEPEVIGTERELKQLVHLYKNLDKREVLDLRGEGELGLEMDDLASEYSAVMKQKRMLDRESKGLKARILQEAMGSDLVFSPLYTLSIAKNTAITVKPLGEGEA